MADSRLNIPGIVLCVMNRKGGSAKSSTCFHLSGYFAKQGLNVLLIDADPQGSLSQGFFGPELIESLEPIETLTALFSDELFVSSAASLIVPTPVERVSIIRANATLDDHNMSLPEESGMKQFVLQGLLEEVVGFDIILIDCPPNLYQCSWNAMVAADFIVVPVPPEDFGTQGLRVVHQAVDNAKTLNAKLELLGHLVTQQNARLLVHRSYEQRLRELYGATVFQAVIPLANAYKLALSARQPVTHFSPRSMAATRVAELGDELLRRMWKATAKGHVA